MLKSHGKAPASGADEVTQTNYKDAQEIDQPPALWLRQKIVWQCYLLRYGLEEDEEVVGRQ